MYVEPRLIGCLSNVRHYNQLSAVTGRSNDTAKTRNIARIDLCYSTRWSDEPASIKCMCYIIRGRSPASTSRFKVHPDVDRVSTTQSHARMEEGVSNEGYEPSL